ncbi:MAG TPA: hypothetical protein DHW82_11160 [Spirochaetia bacterium]|nr:hypothetical protein [Spirochaetia bacterium]
MNLPFSGYYYLTEEGKNEFRKAGLNLLYNEKQEAYFYISQIDFSFLFGLAKNFYLKKVVLLSSALLENRTEWSHLVRDLTYILFDKEVKEETDRVFSQYGFNASKISKEEIESFSMNYQETREEFKKMLLFDTYTIVEDSKEIKDKDEKKKVLSDFIESISEKHWYFLYVSARTEEKISIMEEMYQKLVKLLYIVNIADYLALLIMELAQNAEKAHYEWIAKNEFQQMEQTESFIRQKENRQKIKEKIEEKEIYLEISILWEQIDDKHKLKISILNKGKIQEEKQEEVKNKIEVRTERKPLADLFHNPDQELGAGLGLFYISYIKEECEKQFLEFSSFIEMKEEEVEVSFEITL